MDTDLRVEWPQQLHPDAASGIIDLYNAVSRTETLLGYPGELTAEQQDKVITDLVDDLDRYACRIALFWIGDRLAAMVILRPNSMPNCKHIVELSKGIVHPDFRGGGVLRKAFLIVARECAQNGWERVVLDVRANTRSHAIWSHLGFQEYGRLEDYARVNGLAHMGIYMQQATQSLINNLEK